jgi:hypothetical protein
MPKELPIYRENKPGPGDYTINTDTLKLNRGPIIGSRSELKLITHGKDSPGPGKYEAESSFAHRKSWSIGRKHIRKDETISPGPGAYQIHDNNSGNVFLSNTHQSRNLDFIRDQIHNISVASNKSLPISYLGQKDWKRSSRGTRFTSWLRKSPFSNIKNETPGPGSYAYQNNTIGRSGPYLSLKPKIEVSLPWRQNPGPGTYDTRSTNSTSQGRHNLSIITNTSAKVEKGHKIFQPNPTYYNPNPDLVLPTAGRWIMGRSAKSEFLKEVKERKWEPGPGKYNPKIPKLEPKITLK